MKRILILIIFFINTNIISIEKSNLIGIYDHTWNINDNNINTNDIKISDVVFVESKEEFELEKYFKEIHPKIKVPYILLLNEPKYLSSKVKEHFKDHKIIDCITLNKSNLLDINSLSLLINNIKIQYKPILSIISIIDSKNENIEIFLKKVTQEKRFNGFELILIDIAQEDTKNIVIEEYIKRYTNIIYKKSIEKNNPAKLWNYGIKISSGEFLTIINPNDTRFKNSIMKELNLLIEDTEADLVFTGYKINEKSIVPKDFLQELDYNSSPGPFAIWHKSFHKKYGLFDENFTYLADYEMWARAIYNGSKFKRIPEVGGIHVPKNNNSSVDNEKRIIIQKYEYLWNKDIPKNIFDNYFHNNYWGDPETVSGSGSTINQTIKLRDKLKDLLKNLNIKNLVDIPCGDFNWMKKLISDDSNYIGIDIVKDLIEQNNLKYKSKNINFICLDVINDYVPKADIIICRDLFIHFPNEIIIRTIKNLKDSGSKYLLTTTYPQETEFRINENIKFGQFRIIDLESAPFNLPKPILIIHEESTDGIQNRLKSLGLWNLSDINI